MDIKCCTLPSLRKYLTTLHGVPGILFATLDYLFDNMWGQSHRACTSGYTKKSSKTKGAYIFPVDYYIPCADEVQHGSATMCCMSCLQLEEGRVKPCTSGCGAHHRHVFAIIWKLRHVNNVCMSRAEVDIQRGVANYERRQASHRSDHLSTIGTCKSRTFRGLLNTCRFRHPADDQVTGLCIFRCRIKIWGGHS